MKCYKRLIYKQFFQVSGVCGPQFVSYLRKRFTHLCRALSEDSILVYRFGAPIWPRRKSTKASGVHFFYKSSLFSLELAYVHINISSSTWNGYNCWKSRGETFFQRDSIPILVSRTVKTQSSNCCIFEMKHTTGMETCAKIYFLLIFNLV